MKHYHLILFFITCCFINTSLVFAQEDVHKHKFNPFKYNKDDFPLVFDVDGGIGGGGNGMQAGILVNIDVFHIMAGYRNLTNGLNTTEQRVHEESFYFGYRIRTNKFMFSAAAGFGNIDYKCINEQGFGCADYKEEKLKCVPVNIQLDLIIVDYFAMGVTFDITNSSRENVKGVMLTAKFGLMRDPDF